MIDFLIRLLPLVAPALRYADDKHRNLWNLPLLAYTLFVFALDVIIAHLYFYPAKNEWTISHVLERVAPHDPQMWRLAYWINIFSPNHIKAIS